MPWWIGGALLVLLTGCTARFELQLEATGAGRVKSEVVLTPEMGRYLTDLSELDPELGKSLGSAEGLTQGLANHKGLKSPQAKRSPDGRSFSTEARFESLSALQEPGRAAGASPVFLLQQGKDQSTLTVLLNKKNFRTFSEMTTLTRSPVVQELLPQENQVLTRQEYQELLEYFLQDYSPNPLSLIQASQVELVITLPRKVLSTTLGTAQGNQVILKVPLIDFLILEKPLAGTIRY